MCWQDGDISVISPEGTRSMDGRLQQAKDGLAFVARQAPDAWLIPCAVTGTQAIPLFASILMDAYAGQPGLWAAVPAALGAGRRRRGCQGRA